MPLRRSLLLNRLPHWLLSWPRAKKRLLALGMDTLLCVAALWLVMSLRLERPAPLDARFGWTALFSVLLALPIFVRHGLYRAIFHYAGFNAFMAIVRAHAWYAAFYLPVFGLVGVHEVPRSIGLSQPLLMLVMVSLSRAAARYWIGGHYGGRRGGTGRRRVLIYGAGHTGRELAGALRSHDDMRVVAYVDDDATLHGQSLDGIAVHSPAEMECLVKSQGVSLALLAIPHANREQRNAALAALRPHKLEVRTVPALSDLASGQVRVADVMELDIEDLLGREQVPPHPLMMDRKVRGKVVMVTGAGGSIGSELCRQLLRIRPAVLLLVELTEFALYSIHAELDQMQRTQDLLGVKVVPLLASVRDPVRMGEILSTWKPQTVYHAAAYKHVPLVEHNPAEGVKNNVTGTLIAALQSALHGVSDFVLVSTDKAVRPTNVMGASKRLAEMVLQAHAQVMQERRGKTRFSMVRFGNVLGSSGSVVPLFRKQIREGGPITLTDENITRYFMTIPEAAQLVIQAGSMAKGGEVFVLDMGDPVRIVDLARQMVTLSGLTVKDDEHPYGDIEIKVTGLRPGEKLYEELLIGDNPLPTAHPRIMKAHEDFLPWEELRVWMQRLDAALDVNDVRSIRELLEVLVKDFKPQSDVVDWVWLENARKDSAANTPPAPLPVGNQQVA